MHLASFLCHSGIQWENVWPPSAILRSLSFSGLYTCFSGTITFLSFNLTFLVKNQLGVNTSGPTAFQSECWNPLDSSANSNQNAYEHNTVSLTFVERKGLWLLILAFPVSGPEETPGFP